MTQYALRGASKGPPQRRGPNTGDTMRRQPDLPLSCRPLLASCAAAIADVRAKLERIPRVMSLSDPGATTKTIALRTVGDRIEDLLALAHEHNPELAALVHRTERDRQGVKLADLGYWPDLTAGFEWSHVDGRRPFVPPRTAAGVQPAVQPRQRAGRRQLGPDVPGEPADLVAAHRGRETRGAATMEARSLCVCRPSGRFARGWTSNDGIWGGQGPASTSLTDDVST